LEHSEFCITHATQLVYSCGRLSPELKEYWTHLLRVEFAEDISAEQILLLESKATGIKKDPLGKLRQESPTDEQYVIIISLVRNLCEKARTTDEMPSYRGLKGLVDELMTISGNEKLEGRLDDYVKKLGQKLTAYNQRTIIKVPVTIKPLIIDHLLRWAVIWFLSLNNDLLWLTNFFFIPLLVLAGSYFVRRRLNKKNDRLLSLYGNLSNFQTRTTISSLQYTGMVVMIIISLLVSNVLEYPLIFPLSGYLVYYGLYQSLAAPGHLTEQSIITQINQQAKYYEGLSPDENDEAIVSLQSRLQSVTGRLEAYVLESALFGALAFSGFLQIMAEGLVSFDDLQAFSDNAFKLVSHIVYLQGDEARAILNTLTTKNGLFSLVSVETLVCSILFLAVIAARLRFSDVADKVNHALKLAANFNQKEEVLYAKGTIKEKSQERYEMINRKIRKELTSGQKEIENMGPITTYMRFFRNAGLLTFLIILISSGLLISGFLSLLFAFLGLSTIVYFNKSQLLTMISHLVRQFRVLFVQRGYYFLFLGVLVFISGLYVNTFQSPMADVLVSLGVLLFGLFFFSIIAVSPFVDDTFEAAMGVKVNYNDRKWTVMRLFWAGAVFLIFIVYLFRLMGQQYLAEVPLFLSLPVLASIFIFLGYNLSVKKWMGVLIGIGMSVLLIGVLFKYLHLPAASILGGIGVTIIQVVLFFTVLKFPDKKGRGLLSWLYIMMISYGFGLTISHQAGGSKLLAISLLLLPFGIVLTHRLRHHFRIFFHRVFLLNIIPVTIISLLLISTPYYTLEKAYEHHTLDFEKTAKMVSMSRGNRYGDLQADLNNAEVFNDLKKNVNDHVEWFEDYLNKYGDVGFTSIHRGVIHPYYRIAYLMLEKGSTQEHHALGLKLCRVANEVGEKYNYPTYVFYEHPAEEDSISFNPMIEAELLMALGRKEEAIKFIDGLLETAPKRVQATIQKRAVEMK